MKRRHKQVFPNVAAPGQPKNQCQLSRRLDMLLPAGIPYAEDYCFMMRDAHRRPAQAIRPPAITWHMAFRRPAETTDELWYTNIEHLIIRVFKASVADATSNRAVHGYVEISNLHQVPTLIDSHSRSHSPEISLLRHNYRYHDGCWEVLQEKAADGVGRYETVVIGGRWRGHDYWIRFEVFEEYFCVTSALHVTPQATDAMPPAEPPALVKALEPLVEQMNNRFKELGKQQQELSRDLPSDIQPHVRELYGRLWDDFAHALFDSAFYDAAAGHNVPVRSAEGAEKWELQAFANFRGLVLPVRDVPNKSPATPEEGGALIRMSVAAVPSPVRMPTEQRVNGVSKCLEDNAAANRWVETIFPVLLAQDAPEGHVARHPPFEPTEYTFCKFNRCRYLYGSGFGSQLQPVGAASISGAPLTYLLLSFHDEWREVGRTVLRLHTLGTLRLSALFELKKLMTRDQTLIRLETELRQFSHVRTPADLREQRSTALRVLRRLLPTIHGGGLAGGLNYEDVQLISSQAQGSNPASESWLARTRYIIERSRCKKAVRRTHTALVKLRATIIEQTGRQASRSSRLKEVREAIRACELYDKSDTREQFRSTLLDQVRKALNAMDRGIRDGGVTYRAFRSRYARQLYESIVDALEIHPVPGYQPYHLFVKHRLERAYGLVQAIDVRFKQISEMERQLRRRLDDSKLVNRQNTLRKLQVAAENVFWIVLAPYYAGHVAETLLRDSVTRPGLHIDVWVTALVFAYGLLRACSFYVGEIYRNEDSKLQVQRFDEPD